MVARGFSSENMKQEPVHPIRIQACAWCEKDEMHVPLQDCMGCQDSRDDGETIYCGWSSGERPCTGCGIPAEHCEPETCQIMQAIKRAERKRPVKPLSKTTY